MSGADKPVLGTLRWRARLGILVEGIAWLALLLVAFGWTTFGIDRWLRLEIGYRAALLGLLLAGAAWLLRQRLARPLRVPLDDEELALALERARPGLQQELISGLQFERALAAPAGDASPDLMARVVDRMRARLAELRASLALDRARVAKFGGLLAGALLLGLLPVLAAPGTAWRWFQRNVLLGSIDWPRATLLQFLDAPDGRLKVAEGDDLTVRVAARGVVPEQVRLGLEFAGGEAGSEPMARVGDEFRFTIQTLLEPVVLVATGGDGESAPLHVELVPRPRIDDLQIRIEPPSYIGQEARPFDPAEGDVRLPRGGRLQIRARSDKPLDRGIARLGEQAPIAAAVTEDRRGFTATVEPAQSVLLTLDVVDQDGLGCRNPPRLFVRVIDDQRPGVTYEVHGVGAMVTPIARIPGRVVLRDDHGLGDAQSWMRITEERDTVAAEPDAEEPAAAAPAEFAPVPFEGMAAFVPGAPEFRADVALDLRLLAPDAPAAEPRIRPGQSLALKVTARDRVAPGEPQEGSSDVITLRVVTRDKLLEDLQRRQFEQRRELTEVRIAMLAIRDELKSVLAPNAGDPRSALAAERLRTLARDLRSLGRRTGGVAERYAVIVAEMLNNRLFEATEIGHLTGRIVTPLAGLAAEEFPATAGRTGDFAIDGREDTRSAAVAGCETIIRIVDQVLAEMQEAETLAALLESLRQVIRLEDEAIRGVEQRVRDLGSQIFGDKPRTGNDRKK